MGRRPRLSMRAKSRAHERDTAVRPRVPVRSGLGEPVTTYTFTGPHTSRKHVGKCPQCGKKVARSRTFEHTVNPFNCIGEGETRRPKTWEEVAADVHAEADAWQPDFTCQACDDAQDLANATIPQLISWIRSEGNSRYNHYRDSKPGRAKLCNQRMARYAARVLELDPQRVQWPTSCYYDRVDRKLRYCCYFEFSDGQRCVYSELHGAGYHLSPTGQRVTVGSGTVTR